jgi:hypothetical protein
MPCASHWGYVVYDRQDNTVLYSSLPSSVEDPGGIAEESLYFALRMERARLAIMRS